MRTQVSEGFRWLWDQHLLRMLAVISTALGISTQVLILEAVRQSSLSRTVPMLAFTPVATSLFGVLVLGERPTSLEWIGIVIVVFGALALGLSHSDETRSTRARRAAFDRGSALMLMGAISISAPGRFTPNESVIASRG